MGQEVSNYINNDTLKAYIGIIINPDNDKRIAKSIEKIKISDKLQILVNCLTDCHIYVLHESSIEISLLHEQYLLNDSTYSIPQDEYYIFDGSANSEKLYVLVSVEQNKSLLNLLRMNKNDEIKKLLDQIQNTSQLVNPEQILSRIEIGGNVRNFNSTKGIKLFAGESNILKKYIFDVKR